MQVEEVEDNDDERSRLISARSKVGDD